MLNNNGNFNSSYNNAAVVVDPSQISRAVTIVKLCAALYLVVSSAIIIFGRNVPAIWQGMLGIVGCLEGYYGAESAEPRRVFFFLAVLFPCVAVSLSLAILALTGSNFLVDCQANNSVTVMVQNKTITQQEISGFTQCSTSYQLYGYVELIGGAGFGFVCIIVVATAMRSLRRESAVREAKRSELEQRTILLPSRQI